MIKASRAASAPDGSGARDVLLLPCWRRPEFLWHCLSNLVRADGIEGLHLVISLDTGADPENLQVVEAFADRLASYEVRHALPCPYRRTKQSAHLLLAYLAAAASGARYVYLVEEDIMVARDFFRWHQAVQRAAAPLFCSIATANPNRVVRVPPDAEGYYLSSGDYCSYGVCFSSDVLRQRVRPHVNPGYFRRPKAYLRRHFPHSAVGLGFVEQDGLLRRIQEAGNLPIAFPCHPRAYDAGFYGYNRPGGLRGSLVQRVEELGRTIYDPGRLIELVEASGRLTPGQCVPVDLEPVSWHTLRRIEPSFAA